MSLRVRLIASIVIVLLISLCVGAAIASRHAVRSVRVEMQAALAVGMQALRNGIDNVPHAGDPAAELERLIHTFDGDRHVRAALHDRAAQVRTASTPAWSSSNVPAWFVTFLAPSIPPVHFDVGGGSTITIETDPQNEIGEVWTQLRDDLLAVGLSCGLSLVMVSFVVSRALRPLERVSAALAQVGSGEYAVRIDHAGSPEVAQLAQGFNAMVERLDAAQARNLRLNEQLLTLQEEERADLARDLHDEIGPFLFAVNLDAASITHSALADRISEVPERAQAIREAVEHMQLHVRAMLHRLRPVDPLDGGLACALGDLVSFWSGRQPEIDFKVDITVDDGALSDSTRATIYRLVQEGLNNAVRHGRPRRIEVMIAPGVSGDVVVHVADNGHGVAVLDQAGFGVVGMRERVERLGGQLRVGPNADGKGFIVIARLPTAATRPEAA